MEIKHNELVLVISFYPDNNNYDRIDRTLECMRATVYNSVLEYSIWDTQLQRPVYYATKDFKSVKYYRANA